MEDFYPILCKSRLFSGVEPGELEAMLRGLGARQERFGRELEIFSPGVHIKCLGLVLEGRVHVQREDFWGNRNILTAIGPGQVFGEAYACLPDRALPIRVTAEEPSRVLFLEVGRILTTCPSACAFHSRVVRNLLGVLAERDLAMNEKLIHLTGRSIRGKVLSYLSWESQRQGTRSFTIPYNRQELADYLSVDRSALSAELSRLKAEGVLDYRRDSFTLCKSPET